TLAGANTGKDNLDVPFRLETAETDDTFGQVHDLHRLSHVEHIDRYVAVRRDRRMARGRNDKIARFADGHEVAHHVRMRDGDGTARLDLRLEFRHDRPVGGEHV